MSELGVEEGDDGVHMKRRSRTYGIFDRGTRVIVTDPKFVQEHGAGCKGTIVFFKGGGWYFLRMDMHSCAAGANGGVVMFRPSSFHVIEGRGEVSQEDIAHAEEKSGFTTVFPNGTRVSIINPNTKVQVDDHTGKEGCIVDYKGGGWYFIKLDGVEAVTMSRKGSFVVLSLPPENDPTSAPPKPTAFEMHLRRPKDSSISGSRPQSSHNPKSKHFPATLVNDSAASSSLSSHSSTFGRVVSGGTGSSCASKGESEGDDSGGALGALLSIAMEAECCAQHPSSSKSNPKTASTQISQSSSTLSKHFPSPTAVSHDVRSSTRRCVLPCLFRSQVTSYESFQFRGTLSPSTSPLMKPMAHTRCTFIILPLIHITCFLSRSSAPFSNLRPLAVNGRR
jgi:hypothetical protein